MRQLASRIDASQLILSRRFQVAASTLVGLVVFILASWGVESTVETRQQPGDAGVRGGTGLAADSLAPRVPADRVAISMPSFAAQSLLAEVQVGDRMDIAALFPPGSTLFSQSTVVVRGATVVERPNTASSMPVVFAVSPTEAVALAHLVESGIPLSYSLWADSGPPPLVQPPDGSDVRAQLGATNESPPIESGPPPTDPSAAPAAAEPPPEPSPLPSATPAPTSIRPTAAPTAEATFTPVPSNTPAPSATPEPSPTAEPTETAEPSATPRPEPATSTGEPAAPAPAAPIPAPAGTP